MKSANTRDNQQKAPKLYVYSFGLLFFRRARQILTAHGFEVGFGIPRKGRDAVAVWGRKRTFKRGKLVAEKRKVPLITIEDSFLRSVKTGRQGAPSLGIVLDKTGIFFDATKPNDLNKLITASAGIPTEVQQQATDGLNLLIESQLSKYNTHNLTDPDLPTDYVLVIDQTVGDASISLGGASAETFQNMLDTAAREHPNVKILIKTHPETSAGKRSGHFGNANTTDQIRLYDKPTSPWFLFAGARAVYCVTSQLGMEAIFAGQRPIVFGQPFYSGWGLSDDRHPAQTGKGWRTPEQLFWAAYLKYSMYFDPYFKRSSTFHRTIDALGAQAQNWRDGISGATFFNMRMWKRHHMRRYLGAAKGYIGFAATPEQAVAKAKAKGTPIFRWGVKNQANLDALAAAENIPIVNVEDGFIRSKGLGAQLVRPNSLVFDPIGIYYDPSRPSALETLIENSVDLSARELGRAKNLRNQYVESGFSKYNLPEASPVLSPRENQKIILVVGQVEDDASVVLGTSVVSTNSELLWAARQKYPKDYVVYKVHPDVQAGLRKGAVENEILRVTTDITLSTGNISELISSCDVVCTMTSLTGFEALLQKRHVVCFGVPFYAGWGLTEDMSDIPERRTARPNLDQLTHATLIGYPRYWDPVTLQPCPVEVLIERFQKQEFGRPIGFGYGFAAKLQGVFASYAYLWR